MIDGERDPRVLADLAKGTMRAKIPLLTEVLVGSFDAHHAQAARAILHRLELVEAAPGLCSASAGPSTAPR